MTNQFPLETVRRETPGVENVVHFNNAGSALPPRIVTETMISHLRSEAAIGGYEAAAGAGDRLDAVYRSLAELLGAEPDQIAVVENATRAWDMAVYGYPFRPGERVVTSRAEYVSNMIALLQLEQRHRLEIVVIEDDADGGIDLEALDAELEAGAAMVALTHIPTSGGLINPAEAVGALCRRHDTFYVLDGCQSVGQVPIDVSRIGCDIFAGTGRKYLRGPRGTGFLYAGPRALERIEPPFLDLHAAEWTGDREYRIRSDARRFENWETNFAGKLGLGAAVDYARSLGIEQTSERLRALAARLRTELAAVDRVTVHDKGRERGGIVTFAVDGVAATEVKDRLTELSINTTTSPAGHARLDLPHRGLDALVRASVHYYNTDEEIDRFIDALGPIVSG